MKIGIFDSGLGGLIVLKGVVKKLPEYDYVYLGDTAHMPYGNRSQDEIYKFTRRAMEFLFKQGCQLVIVACNTSSSRALRKLQREFLPKKYPERKILGVIIPTVEAAGALKNLKKLAVLGTKATVNSKAYVKEMRKLHPKVITSQAAAPKLATAIELGNPQYVKKLTTEYLKPLIKNNPDVLILGCTHYSIIKPLIKSLIPKKTKVIDQADEVPKKLSLYLRRHYEIRKNLSKNRQRGLYITQKTEKNTRLSKLWFGKAAKLKLVKIN